MKVLLNFCLQHIHNLIINLSQQKYDVMMWSDVSSCSVQWCFGSFGFCISDKQGNMLHFKNCILIYLDFADIIAIMVCNFFPQHLAKNCSWLMDAEIWINFFQSAVFEGPCSSTSTLAWPLAAVTGERNWMGKGKWDMFSFSTPPCCPWQPLPLPLLLKWQADSGPNISPCPMGWLSSLFHKHTWELSTPFLSLPLNIII